MSTTDEKAAEIKKPVLSGGFDKDIALLQLEAAILPIHYEQLLQAAGNREGIARESLQDFVRREGMDIKLIREENTTAVLVYNREKSRVSVAFSASDETKDIIDNANFIPVAHDTKGHVHAGFKSASDRVAEEIKKEVIAFSQAASGRVDVDLAGFSQGGASALITAADWMKKDGFLSTQPQIQLSSVHTFGSPPAGTKVFMDEVQDLATRHGAKLVRIVHEDDPIPTMMTKDGQWWTPPIYSHADSGVLLRGNGTQKDWGAHDPFAYFEKISALPHMAEGKPQKDHISSVEPSIRAEGILLADSFVAVAEGAVLKSPTPDKSRMETALRHQPASSR